MAKFNSSNSRRPRQDKDSRGKEQRGYREDTRNSRRPRPDSNEGQERREGAISFYRKKQRSQVGRQDKPSYNSGERPAKRDFKGRDGQGNRFERRDDKRGNSGGRQFDKPDHYGKSRRFDKEEGRDRPRGFGKPNRFDKDDSRNSSGYGKPRRFDKDDSRSSSGYGKPRRFEDNEERGSSRGGQRGDTRGGSRSTGRDFKGGNRFDKPGHYGKSGRFNKEDGNDRPRGFGKPNRFDKDDSRNSRGYGKPRRFEDNEERGGSRGGQRGDTRGGSRDGQHGGSRSTGRDFKGGNRFDKPGHYGKSGRFNKEDGNNKPRGYGRSSRFDNENRDDRPRRFDKADKFERPARNSRPDKYASQDRKDQHYGKAEQDGKGTEQRRPRTKTNAAAPAKTLAKGKAKSKPDFDQPDAIRLNRYIANAGICSRRDADKLIEAGQIKVNGEVVTELGTKVLPTDKVVYNGKKLNREKPVYVLLNKPKDFITTTEDPQDRKTVMDLVGNAANERIYPVGRLDRNTTGLLVLTNDGELAEKLAHPSFRVKKIYQVDLDRPLTKNHLEEIKKGIELEDGPAPVDDIQVLNQDRDILGVEIHIGRNRIVRRIFEHLGYEVIRLDRVMYAGLTKKNLPRGTWRYLNDQELIRLKHLNKG